MSAPSFPTDGLPILVAHDLGPGGRRAANLGAAIARALAAPLRLVHAMDAARDADFGAIPAGIAPAVEVLRARIEQRLAEERAALGAEVERLRTAGLAQVDSEHVEGRAWEAIVAVAAREGAQLVVVAAHSGEPVAHERASGVARLLGSTAERVVRHAGVTVAVAADEPVPAGLFAGAPWVVGVDLGPTSSPPLETARRLAARWGGRVLAVHATSPERAGEAALIAEVQRWASHASAVSAIVTAGPAADAFARVTAAERAGALVLGVNEHRGLLARALGRDALGPTFRLTRVPVLCVPS
jgi:nucleotide-binding universal stress UspA family protein